MQIVFASTLLASEDSADLKIGPTDLRVNGRQAVDVIELARASAVSVIPRGNRATTVSFSVVHRFTSRRLAGVFRATHFGTLEASGDLVFTDGVSGDQSDSTLADAVLESCDPVQQGLAVVVSYVFRGGLFTADAFPADDAAVISASTINDGFIFTNSGSSSWLQLMDQGTWAWMSCWLESRVFKVGHGAPPGTIAWRTKLGFFQLRDLTDACWRSLWFQGVVLVIGPADSSADDVTAYVGNAAWRKKAGDDGSLLQLLDQTDGAKFRTLILTNGVAAPGPLEA